MNEVMKILNSKQFRDLVLSHITKVPDQSLRERFSQQINNCSGTPINVSRTNLNNEGKHFVQVSSCSVMLKNKEIIWQP